jgi:23S rRNA (uracil1939-C5)-methyltransferase
MGIKMSRSYLNLFTAQLDIFMPRTRQRIPQTPTEATVERFAHDGRGIAQLDGKVVFISGALPQEKVVFRYLSRQRHFDEGRVLEVLQAAPERVTTLCPHAGICGGCSLQHLNSDAQIALKQAMLLEQIQHIAQTQAEEIAAPLRSSLSGYRHKARLGVRHVPAKGGMLVGFREEKNRYLADLSRCDVLHHSIGERFVELRNCLDTLECKLHIPQIEVAIGDHQTACVIRHLVPLSLEDQQRLIAFAQHYQIALYTQAKGIDSITALWPPNLPLDGLYYRHPDYDVTIHFAPSDFTQINPDMNRQMVKQALHWLNASPNDDVLELFCGLGNFTLPLARTVKQVTAVEGDAQLISRAKANANTHELYNIDYYVANLADAQLKADWLQQSYPYLLLDPPRSGAQEILQVLPLQQTKRMVYISCNPATLARDVGFLVHQHGFRLARIGIMDMFPQTAHVESMALLIR